MKRILAILLCAAMMFAVLTACGGTGDSAEKNGGEVNIMTYEGYIPESVQQSFTEKTGIKINYTPISSNEEMYEKLKSSGDLYDLIIASDYMLDTMVKEDMLAELDTSKIPNFSNINPDYQSQFYDSENKFTVPYASGRPVIVYDKNKVDFEITSYEDLWNESLKDSVVMIDEIRVVTGITLLTMGYGMNETDPAVLNAAMEKMIALKPNVKQFSSNFPEQTLQSGDAAVGLFFSSSAAALDVNNTDNLKVVYPKEGLGFGIDCFAMSKSAPNADNAYALLDYILDAKIGAECSEGIYYLCCNKAAEEYLSDSYKNNPALFITEEFKDAGFILPLDDETSKVYSDNWTTFKNS